LRGHIYCISAGTPHKQLMFCVYCAALCTSIIRNKSIRQEGNYSPNHGSLKNNYSFHDSFVRWTCCYISERVASEQNIHLGHQSDVFCACNNTMMCVCVVWCVCGVWVCVCVVCVCVCVLCKFVVRQQEHLNVTAAAGMSVSILSRQTLRDFRVKKLLFWRNGVFLYHDGWCAVRDGRPGRRWQPTVGNAWCPSVCVDV